MLPFTSGMEGSGVVDDPYQNDCRLYLNHQNGMTYPIFRHLTV